MKPVLIHLVWAVLSDFASYPDWNPYLVHVEGEARVGTELSLTIVQRNWDAPFTVPATLTEVEPGSMLGWRGVAFFEGVHDTHHTFRLDPLPGDRTRLRQAEAFAGVLPHLIYDDTLRGHTQAAFRAMNEALAARIERGHPDTLESRADRE